MGETNDNDRKDILSRPGNNQVLRNSTLEKQIKPLHICLLNDNIYLIAAQAIEKIQAVDSKYVLLLNDNQPAEVDEEDPYADFEIPDDLMW